MVGGARRPHEGATLSAGAIPRILETAKSADVADVLHKDLGLRNVTMVGMIPLAGGEATVAGRALTMRIGPSKTGREVAKFAEFVELAGKSDVLVIDAGGDTSFASWGGNNAAKAKAKGVVGLVVDGAVRDVDEIEQIGFPIFCKGYSPSSWRGVAETVTLNEPVVCGGVIVSPGDCVVGDRSGVAVIPSSSVDDVGRLLDTRGRSSGGQGPK